MELVDIDDIVKEDKVQENADKPEVSENNETIDDIKEQIDEKSEKVEVKPKGKQRGGRKADPNKPDPREKIACPHCGLMLSRHTIDYKHKCKAKKQEEVVKVEPNEEVKQEEEAPPAIKRTMNRQPADDPVREMINDPNQLNMFIAEHLKNEKMAKANKKAQGRNIFTVTYNSTKGTLSISIVAPQTFMILTDADLKTKLNNTWGGTSFDSNNPMDMNEVIKNTEGNSPEYTNASPYNSGFLHLMNVHNIYRHSANLGTFSTLGCRGENTIIKTNSSNK